LAGESVLIVDDDPFMIELLSGSLAEAGYTVATATNGSEALNHVNRGEFQVALVDLSLPDTDGMELVDGISAGLSDVQIIIMTGYPSIQSTIEALRRGAQDYIVKPFKIPEVQAAVDRALKNQGLQQEVRELRRRVRELERELHQSRSAPGRPQPQQAAAPLPGAYGAPTARRPPAPDQEDPDRESE